MKSLNRNERAFTGLEAAIVLIAFVVVAAVFSYVVLGAGFFTTQKSQETVHTGVEQASSNIEVSGGVIADGGTNELSTVTFYLQTAAGGEPVNVQNITYTVSTASTAPRVVEYSDLSVGNNASSWAAQEDSDYLLEKFEMYKVTIDVSLDDIVANEKFNIDVVPPKGAALPIIRTAPAEITSGNKYEVW